MSKSDGRSMMAPRAVLLAAVSIAAIVSTSDHPVGAATLYGLVDTGELFASADKGVTWHVRATLPTSDAIGIASSTDGPNMFLATRSGVVYRSSDDEDTWLAIGTIPAGNVVDIAIRGDGGILLLTATGAVYVSTDGGTNFVAQASLSGSNFVSLSVSPCNNPTSAA